MWEAKKQRFQWMPIVLEPYVGLLIWLNFSPPPNPWWGFTNIYIRRRTVPSVAASSFRKCIGDKSATLIYIQFADVLPKQGFVSWVKINRWPMFQKTSNPLQTLRTQGLRLMVTQLTKASLVSLPWATRHQWITMMFRIHKMSPVKVKPKVNVISSLLFRILWAFQVPRGKLGSPRNLGSMVSFNGLFHLLINEIY